MGRPRSFDEAEVIKLALAEFWSRGYDEVTFRDLAAKTGVGLRSLSNAFGDKETLYIRVLESYLAMVEENLPKLFPPTGLESIARFFAVLVQEHPSDAPRQNGCLVVNQMTEAPFHDNRLSEIIQRYKTLVKGHFASSLAASKIPDHQGDKAEFLLTIFIGAQLTIRASRDTQAAAGTERHVAEMLRLWSAQPK